MVGGEMIPCRSQKRARGPAGMSVSRHSTWNRTTILERAYRGGTRPRHRHLQPADYRVISTSVLADGRCRVMVETDQPPGCPSCGVVPSRRKERRVQRIRDIPVAGPVEVLRSKYRCE